MACLLNWALLAHIVTAAYDISYGTDEDLTSFVSRPDIRVPLFEVKIHDRQAILPGNWFVSPYTYVGQQQHPKHVYQPCHIGPLIHDTDGGLIWAGACDLQNDNAHDFRPVNINGSDYLSFIRLNPSSAQNGKGYGVVLNSSYDVITDIPHRPGTKSFNMHEFRVIEAGEQMNALYLGVQYLFADLRNVNTSLDEGWIADVGIREADLQTQETLFEWWPSHHIDPAESKSMLGLEHASVAQKPWNWFHANSVEKNQDGDYLLSARYTSTIYKINGRDGSILWRLGGTNSTFHLDGFNFSFQHDARWISCTAEEEVISFLDNGADDASGTNTTETSSALIVALDKQSTPPSARILKRIWRPDGNLSRLRGNFQTFAHSSNVVVGWSDAGYITEHDERGRLIAETKFRSARMGTYRSYKGNFTATLSRPPDVAAYAFGTSPARCVTVVYTSWNGATEVATWNFYSSPSPQGGTHTLLGSLSKAGFETMFQTDESVRYVFTEAVDKDGKVLQNGRSASVEVHSQVGLGQTVGDDERFRIEL